MFNRFKPFKLLSLVLLCFSFSATAENRIKPYINISNAYTSIDQAKQEIIQKVTAAGFDLLGEYSPYANAQVVVISDSSLNAAAAKSEHGGFGAAIRISFTKTDAGIQLSYVNPAYMSGIYRMSDLSMVSTSLVGALGKGTPFGSEKGLKASKLKKYHYMMAMPYFDDIDVLAEYDTYKAALKSVETNLANGVAGTSKIYMTTINGKDETLFGVGLTQGEGADSVVMTNADLAALKHTAHLPYEILVSGKQVIALRGRFRIAQSFPDLTMGTFMKIRSAPGAIKQALMAVAQPPLTQ